MMPNFYFLKAENHVTATVEHSFPSGATIINQMVMLHTTSWIQAI